MTNMIQIQQGLEETNMVMMQKQQGIVTVLGLNCDTNKPSSEYSSLRRTLSADMSSQKWLSNKSEEVCMQHSSTNKAIIADSLSSPAEEEGDEAEAERERLEIWSSIQRNKKEEQEKAGQGGAFDMWNSLVSLKDNSKSLPATPYVHPLVKRSKSCLSEKSLEICTESLGSETGSDGLFSSYPSSETEEEEKQQEKEQDKVVEQQQEQEQEEEQEPKNNYYATKKYSPSSSSSSSSRSFPPPLPSLGPSLHMRTRRDNGRLVLEAVSVPNNNNFAVQRQGGRLVLTFANQETKDEDADADEEVGEESYDDAGVAVDELEEEFDEGFEEGVHDEEESEDETEDESDETEEVEDVKDVESVVIEKVAAPLVSSEITTTTTNGVHRLAFMMNNKSIGLVNRKPEWSEKLNGVDVNVVEVETSPVAKSLPPRPRVARLIPSTNFNAYEYYWKTKPAAAAAAQGGATVTATATTLSNSLPHHHKQHNNNNNNKTSTTLVNNNSINKVIFSGDFKQMPYDQRQQLMVVREKNGDYKLVHNLDQSCKDSRRSFLFWEPYCIATS